ncbi:hypothetical protein KEM56_003490, partial [Ascosphaera pollenicola]
MAKRGWKQKGFLLQRHIRKTSSKNAFVVELSQDVIEKVAARLAIRDRTIHQLLPETVDILKPITEIPLKQSQALIFVGQKKQEVEMPALKIDMKLVFPYWPHDEQAEAVAHLLYRNRDLILIVKTSFGKNTVMQAFSLLRPNTITIVIIPLDQIGKEQLAKIETLGGSAFFLNAQTKTHDNLKKIKGGKFTHILTSPELAVSNAMRLIWQTSKVNEKLGLIVIYEAHLMYELDRFVPG